MQNVIMTASTILLSAIFGVSASGPAAMGPSLKGATGWLNGEAMQLQDLRGKVVLIDFWTYTCINWRRTLPYLQEWQKKYKDQGLVIIGVHTPEFSFEYKTENVSRSIKEMNIGYPVALDNNYSIWNSFQNEYWPALYLIDAKGHIRYQKFGEGDYQETELKIQSLLKGTAAKNISNSTVELAPGGAEAAADWDNLQSPENFLGYERTQGFASHEAAAIDKLRVYSTPMKLQLNQWALSGEWILQKENVLLKKAEGKLVYKFHSRDVNLIMGAVAPGMSIKFRVLIDGQVPGNAHGLDMDENGNGNVNEHRMYQLIRQQAPIVDREFQIEFLGAEVEVFDFTFG